MFQFVGYNFFGGDGALNAAPSFVDNISKIKLQNAIFDHLNISKDTSIPNSTEKPTDWNYDTIFDAGFNGNLDGGNVNFLIEQISAVKIKRRIKGEFNWITLKTIPINSVEDLTFSFNDTLNANNVEYEYAFVPIINDIEGNYIINSVLSRFNGVFIGDAKSTYRFLYEVEYGSNARNQQVNSFQLLGKKYPVIVANGELSYESGSVSATILNDDFEKTGIINREEITKRKDILKDFLTDHKSKILKDWNGNLWLCMIVDNIGISYKSGSGMGIPSIQFNWVEIGDANSQKDLFTNGILDEV